MRGFSFFVGLALMVFVGLASFTVFSFYLYQVFTHAQQFAFLW